MNLDAVRGAFGGAASWWDAHGYQVILWGLVATAGYMLVSLLWARHKGHVPRWVSNVASFAVLVLCAEGMWEVAREKLALPTFLAAAVFFVFEAMLVSEALLARAHYHRTTLRDADGNVTRWGTPGRHGTAVWVIAAVSGGIVSLNSASLVEFPLRLALPLGAAYMFMNTLMAAGRGESERSSWRWTPRRLLLWVGAIEPGERDLDQVHAGHLLNRMTWTAHRVHVVPADSRRRAWYERRLQRQTLKASDETVSEVAARLARVHQVIERTSPTDAALRAAAVADVQADADRRLAEAKRQREAEVAAARAAAETTATEARQSAEAEVASIRADAEAAVAAVRAEAERATAAQRAETERIVAEVTAARERAEEGLRAELRQLATTASGTDRQRAAEVADLHRQVRESAEAAASWKTRAEHVTRQAEELGRTVEQLRPLVDQVAGLKGEVERLRSEASTARSNAETSAARLTEMTSEVERLKATRTRSAPAPSRVAESPGWRQVPATAGQPTASAGTSALAPQTDPVADRLPRGELKAQVFAVLDELAPLADAVPGEVAATVAQRVPAANEETAGRYYRAWRTEMSEGRRPLTAVHGRRLRAVPTAEQ